MKSVLVVYKKSTRARILAQSDGKKLLGDLAKADTEAIERIDTSHDAHVKTLDLARATLESTDVSVEYAEYDDVQPGKWDLVVSVGGDGTLLWASHAVGAHTPILGINSSPKTSVGYFCAGDTETVREVIAQALKSELNETSLTRMEALLDGVSVSKRVLNDVLFCHACPASMSRYRISTNGSAELQTSSGIWISTAAGSTGAMRSAGGRVCQMDEHGLQFLVREPYLPSESTLRTGFIPPGDELRIDNLTLEGRIYLDGAQKMREIGLGSTLSLRQSDEPLRLLTRRRLA